jgi:hypothetical protein
MKTESTLAILSAFIILFGLPVYAETVTTNETTVQRTAPDNYSKTVTEETSTTSGTDVPDAVPAPEKPYTTSKSSSVTQTDSLGNQRKVVTKQTLNGDGTMAREVYHEEKNY